MKNKKTTSLAKKQYIFLVALISVSIISGTLAYFSIAYIWLWIAYILFNYTIIYFHKDIYNILFRRKK